MKRNPPSTTTITNSSETNTSTTNMQPEFVRQRQDSGSSRFSGLFGRGNNNNNKGGGNGNEYERRQTRAGSVITDVSVGGDDSSSRRSSATSESSEMFVSRQVERQARPLEGRKEDKRVGSWRGEGAFIGGALEIAFDI